MSDRVTAGPTGEPVRRPPAALLAAILVLLAGCSTPDWMAVPDWANPVEWLADDTPASEPGSAEAPGPGGGDSFPKLSSVPDNPPPSSSEPERRAIADGLIADRANARYTDQKLRAGAPDEPVSRPPARSAQAKQPPAVRSAKATKPPVAPPAPPPPSAETTVTRAPAPPPARSSVAARMPRPVAGSPTPMIAAMTQRYADGSLRPPRLSAGEATLSPPPPVVPPPATAIAPPAAPPVAPPAMAPSRSRARVPAPLPPAVVPPAPRLTELAPRSPMAAAAVAAPPAPPSIAAAPAAAYPPLLASRPGGGPGGGQVTPPPILPSAPGQDVLAQVYAQQLRASGVTAFAGPTDPRFAAPAARPLSNFAAPVPSIVQNTYNEPLVRSMPPGGLAGSVSGATRGSYGPAAAMVNFANGSARLSAKARQRIKQVADLVKARGGAVRVIGHASSRTKDLPVAQHVVANFNISLARGQAVARELIRRGVPPRSVFVEAKGDGEPLYLESMPSGEARNRRVEIFLEN